MNRAHLCLVVLLVTSSASAHVNTKSSWPRVHHIRRLLTEQYTVTSSVTTFTSELGMHSVGHGCVARCLHALSNVV
jgi:hypothetical protein